MQLWKVYHLPAPSFLKPAGTVVESYGYGFLETFQHMKAIKDVHDRLVTQSIPFQRRDLDLPCDRLPFSREKIYVGSDYRGQYIREFSGINVTYIEDSPW